MQKDTPSPVLDTDSSHFDSFFSIKSTKSLITLRDALKEEVWAKKWVKLCVYQFFFTCGLVLYFGLCLYGYLSTVDPFAPRIIRNKRNPALMFRPLPQNAYSTLIHFKHGGSGNWQKLRASANDFMKPYSGFGKFLGPSEKCTWTTKLDRERRCHVAVRKWFNLTTTVECTNPEAFGYIRGHPCVAIKMNRIYGWEPEPYYNMTEIENIPTMPDDLKENINKTWTKFCKGKENENKCPRLRMTWVSCQGATPHDEEFLGPIMYMPIRGYPGFFYPYMNQQLYLSPVVWLQMNNIYPGVLITVECKLWAKNIRHDPDDPMVGGVRFEIMMD